MESELVLVKLFVSTLTNDFLYSYFIVHAEPIVSFPEEKFNKLAVSNIYM
jgi:hypothetical protein